MVGWHHQFNGHELGQILRDGKGQGSLASCSPWSHNESDMTWQLNNNNINIFMQLVKIFFLFCEKGLGILKETAVNMQIDLGIMDVLTLLILPVNKYEIYFLLCLINISFMHLLKVFIHRSFNTLLEFISMYFFDAIVNGIICISVICFCVWPR